MIYRTALRVMPPARLRRTPVPHGGNQKDRTGSPSRQERQENVGCGVSPISVAFCFAIGIILPISGLNKQTDIIQQFSRKRGTHIICG